jgi:hypothetical protein
MSITRRLDALEDAARRSAAFGLPRDPKEQLELLQRIRAERARRKLAAIRSDPRGYALEVLEILKQLEPAQQALVVEAITKG